jgi:hypothetical protein
LNIAPSSSLRGSITCDIEPGTLFLLEQEEGWRMSPYRAVLACPGCGTLGLLTQAQYSGHQPVLCLAERCCAEYMLHNRQIRFRPPQ